LSTPRFLADEDLRHRIIEAARRLEPGLVILRAVDVGLQSASADAILDYAEANELLVVSHDESTLKPLAEARIQAGQGITGLFLVPQHRRPREAAESLVLIWAASQAEEWKDRVVYVSF